MEISPSPAGRSVLVHCLGEYTHVTLERTITVLVPDDIGVDLQDPEDIDESIHDWIYDMAGTLGLKVRTSTLTSTEGWDVDWTRHDDRFEPADWTFTIIPTGPE